MFGEGQPIPKPRGVVQERLSVKNKGDAADNLGGAEEKSDAYKKGKEPGYSDKGGHKERSEKNDPKHGDHWKKEEKKGK